MTYANPQVPHEVNVSKESLVFTALKLLSGIVLIVVAGFIAIYFAFRAGVHYIPFSFETSISSDIASSLAKPVTNPVRVQAQSKLQALAETLAQKMGAPADMPIHIYLTTDSEPNAFATLGGHIVVTQGLINTVNSENALAMVLAHELAHVKNRDPLASLGTGITATIFIAVLTGSDGGAIQGIAGNLTQLSFSRRQERLADEDATRALMALYGHTYGADEFFQTMLDKYGASAKTTEFFQTHPDTQKRITAIRNTQQGQSQALTPLPAEIAAIKKR